MKRSRVEVDTVAVKLSEGEYLQYVVASPRPKFGFSLIDTRTNEIILSHSTPATILDPPTFTRLWPVVGDWARRESSMVLSLEFETARGQSTFQVQHRRSDGSWHAVIDIDFHGSEPGDAVQYGFRVLAD